jgi:hypothetical protein
MKYAVEMGSVAMVYTPSFIKTVPGMQMLKNGGGTDTQTVR